MAKKEIDVCPTFTLDIGSKKIVIDFNQVLLKDTFAIGKDLGDIRALRHDMKANPMLEEESLEDWQKRIGSAIDDEFAKRKKGESVDAHVARLNTPKFDNFNVGFEFLSKLCSRFNQPEVTMDEFQSCKWTEVRTFLHNICQEAEIGAPEFFPKRILSR